MSKKQEAEEVEYNAKEDPKTPQSDLGDATFPRILYHVSGEEMIFSSRDEFDKVDDGSWATNPGVHGRFTAPSVDQMKEKK